MTARFHPGDTVIVTKEPPEGWHDNVRVGDLIRIDMVEPGLRPGDDGYGQEGWVQEAFYSGWKVGYGTADVPQDCVDVAPDENLPTPEDLVKDIASAAMDLRDCDIHSIDYEPDGFFAVGKTSSGYPFAFKAKVEIESVYLCDD